MHAPSGPRPFGAESPPSVEPALAPVRPRQAAQASVAVVVGAGTRVRCRALSGLLDGPGLQVVAEAVTPADIASAVTAHRPGAVLLDLDLDSGGLAAIEAIMATTPTPIVVCGAAAEQPAAALAAGAVDVVGALDAPPTSPQYVTALRRHLRIASRVKVITHPRGRWRARGLHPVARALDGGATTLDRPTGESALRLVAIGASTGGPPALATILADLPADLAVPVLVVQHMADGFVEGLAAWLDSICELPVGVATDGMRLEPGTVTIAPARMNLRVRPGLRVELRAPDVGQFHSPGIDVTFASVAAACGARALGILLTGMGRDGASGLRLMRERGALTFGQDEPTSVVWGMPAAAQALDAVEVELALPAIAAALTDAVRRRPGRA